MKSLLAAVCLLFFFSTLSFAQKKDEINYSDAFQMDSSEYFLIPKLVDNDNHDDYGKGKGYFLWGNYSDISFYNTQTNQTKKVFAGQLALIQPFFATRYRSYYDEDKKPDPPANILPNHVVYLARTDNFNKDNGLDSDDPVYLYISTRTGENLKQITPSGIHVMSWILSADKKIILVKAMSDKNNNKKFGNGDDESYYRIDLHEDISKIKCYPISL